MQYKEIVYLKEDKGKMEVITRFCNIHNYEVVSHAITSNSDYSVFFRKVEG